MKLSTGQLLVILKLKTLPCRAYAPRASLDATACSAGCNWAVDNGYIVFTHDLDFGTLLAIFEANTPSVVQVRTQNVFPDRLGKIVLNTLKQFKSELETGVLITVNESQAKARILPIRRNY